MAIWDDWEFDWEIFGWCVAAWAICVAILFKGIVFGDPSKIILFGIPWPIMRVILAILALPLGYLGASFFLSRME